MASLPNALRSRTMQPCTTLAHDAGGASPQMASARESG